MVQVEAVKIQKELAAYVRAANGAGAARKQGSGQTAGFLLLLAFACDGGSPAFAGLLAANRPLF